MRARLLTLAAWASLAGCTDGYFASPADGNEPSQVALTVDASQLTGGPADAFLRADRVTLVLVDPDDGGIVLTESGALDTGTPEVRLRIEVEVGAQPREFELRTVLFLGQAPLFVGARLVELRPGATTEAAVTLEPVPASVVGPAVLPEFTFYGESRPLEAAVVMATGDTIQGLQPAWVSLDAQVVAVEGGASAETRAVAVADGETQLVASAGNEVSAHVVDVSVRAEVVGVRVDPPSVELELGESATLQATALDAGGQAVPGRTTLWSSTDESVATVDQSGEVAALEPGEAGIVAWIEGVADTADIVVAEPPPPPTPLNPTVVWANGVRVGWSDQSGGSAMVEVHRRVNSASFDALELGAGFERIAVLPRGTVSFIDPDPVPGFLDYVLVACGDFGCSEPSEPVTFGFEVAPEAETLAATMDDGFLDLRGRVDPRGLPTSAIFEVDFSPAFPEPIRTDDIATGDGFGFVDVSGFLSGPPAGQTLYIRLIAENEAGTSFGSVVSITTPPGGAAPGRR